MNAKHFTLLTFGTFLLIAIAALIFVFAGTEWQGDNNESTWVLFGGFLVYFLAFLTFNRGWGPTESTIHYLQSFDRSATTDEVLGIFKKYSFFLLLGALLLLITAIASIFIY